MKKIFRIAFWPIIILKRKLSRFRAETRLRDVFAYDEERFAKYSGITHRDNREARLANLIMTYHVVEKGLTMPCRRLNFGHEKINELMKYIVEFEDSYGKEEPQVLHAAAVIKDYLGLHERAGYDFETDADYWMSIRKFCAAHANILTSGQLHMTCEQYFSRLAAPFADFARSRRTVRHYEGHVDVERIRRAVELAMTAPSACNRQHVRVHCISNHREQNELFKIQNGNRGFGDGADKVLCITSDLADLQSWEERNDIYVNAGIFIMNLCYALHVECIAHCILNWHARRDEDMHMRKLLSIPPGETIVAFISCGNAPAEFDIAASPRKSIGEVFFEHR